MTDAGKTFYFGEYQGFRQVLGTTQVFPVPTARRAPGRDYDGFPGDTLSFPWIPESRSAGAVSAAELSQGPTALIPMLRRRRW